MTGQLADDVRMTRFSATRVTRVVKQLTAKGRSPMAARENWLRAVAARVATGCPDLAGVAEEILGARPAEEDVLAGLSIGEVGVCYEALMAELDRGSRRSSGQYFTPDDAAHFMASQAADFPEGVWLDPCSGVGNLAWHLVAVQSDRAAFVRDSLVLMDQDKTALLTAVVLIGADHLKPGDVAGFRALHERCVQRDALALADWPDHDYVIVNPPYARDDRPRKSYETRSTKESFAYFMERVAQSADGFVAVTPASYVSAPKFAVLRDLLRKAYEGGDVFVFDNVPDTLFRGYKYGSSNTSRTNFVRAAITVCPPAADAWRITPIIRWRAASRERMFAGIPSLLGPMQFGPAREWSKLLPGVNGSWKKLKSAPRALKDLVVLEETEFSLTVALTPRYYISAAYRDLDRGSKAVLHFKSEEDRDLAALVLNSSLPYLWWRALDGGVTLPRRVLLSVPIPDWVGAHPRKDLVSQLRETEESSLVTKLNAGKVNENVKRPRDLVGKLDLIVLPDGIPDLALLFTEDMFPDSVS